MRFASVHCLDRKYLMQSSHNPYMSAPLLLPFDTNEHLTFRFIVFWDVIRGGADKSLARLGRKSATAAKLGIYSTYSPRSPTHFLARCSNFCKPLKKFRSLSVQPGLRGSNGLRVGKNMVIFQLFFSVQGTDGSPTGPDPENRVGNQDNGNQGRPFSSGLQVPGEPGHSRARTRPTW